MPNMNLKSTPMPVQEPSVRAHNYGEVALGYTKEMAIDEANRCLHCKNSPCVSGCPVSIDIPNFIQKLREDNIGDAYKIITEASSLPAVCSRVCPQESQCQKVCVRGIKGEPVAIGRLERYVADHHEEVKVEVPASNGHKVAVIGAGPSGLSCAGALARKGYDVTVFEALHKAGGVLVYGIPEFRLPKSIVEKEVNSIKEMGVKFYTNTVIGKSLTYEDLQEMGFEAYFLGTGAGLPRFMNIKGENLKGVYSANEFLTRANLMKAYKDNSDTPIMHGQNVVVVGAGNVAMDAARSALRLGAKEVHIVYRRSAEEIPARKEEVEHAKEEGIIFDLLRNPVELFGDENGFVKEAKVIKMELGEPDASGRRSPMEVAGSEYLIPCDCVIMSLGTSPNPLVKDCIPGLPFERHGCIIAEEETGKTALDYAFAGGDAVTGAATVILAMRAGKNAAESIDAYLSKKQ